MFAYTISWSSAKSYKRIWMIVFTLFLPSFWPKLMRIFVIKLVIVRRIWININTSSFHNGYFSNIMILLRNSCKYTITRPIKSQCLVLNPVNIVQFFKIFFCDILLTLYNTINMLSKFVLYSFVFRN